MTSTTRNTEEDLDNIKEPGKSRILHLLVIASIVTAMLVSPITVLKIIVPTGHWRFLPMIIFIVAMEGGLTTWWLEKKRRRVDQHFYRISEIILLIVALRFSSWIVAGNLPNIVGIRAFVLDPSHVIDITFVLFVLLAFFAWERSITFSSIFDKISLSAKEIAYYTIPTAERLQSRIIGIVPKNRIQLQQNFFRQWLIGGIILIIFVVITTFDLPGRSAVTSAGTNIRNIGRLGLRSDILLALIIYFIGGLWLASLGRMHILQARWLTSGLTADIEILHNWRTRGLILLLLLAIGAAFLPIGSSFAFSRIIVAILSFVAIAFSLFLTLLAYIYYYISNLLGDTAPISPPPQIDLSQFSQATNLRESSSNVPALILGSIFWIGVITIVVLALIFFLRDRGITLEGTQLNRTWKSIIAWLQNLWEKINGYSKSLSFPRRNRLKPSTPAIDTQSLPWRFIRINALSPRDQIIYLYLSIVKRAGKKGVRRVPNKTPSEYASDLEDAWPEVRSDIQYLTEEFQDARYSTKTIDRERSSIIQEAFSRLRSTLRHSKVK